MVGGCSGAPSIAGISTLFCPSIRTRQVIRPTLTFESPPAVASRYCLPPAINGPLSLDSSSSFAIASSRFNCVAGNGWKSHEYTACVSCHLYVSSDP
jgi:hypothetical protein